MTEEPDYLDAAAVTETLDSCIEQLRYVRTRVLLRSDGSTASLDDAAMLRTLDGVEALLMRVAASVATRR